jgi:hypothetical protein
LPEPIVQQVQQIVRQARQEQAEEAARTPKPWEGRSGVIGMFAHLGIQTPTLDEFEEARREMWTNFPREFPDASR